MTTFTFPSGREITIAPIIRGEMKPMPPSAKKRPSACKHLGGPATIQSYGCLGPQMGSTWVCNHPEHTFAAPLAIIEIPGATACATCPHWEPAPEPGYARLGLNKLTAEYKWRAAGKPLRSPPEVAALFKICQACPFFAHSRNRNYCGKCGCPLNLRADGSPNKLAWGTEACPLDPPRWVAAVAAP